MKEVLDSDEKILRKALPVFLPFVIRNVPTLLMTLASAIFTYAWFTTFHSAFSAFPTSDAENSLIGFQNMLYFVIAVPILQAIYQIVLPIFIYPNTEYAFTEKRVALKSGFLGIDYKTIDYDQITDIEVRVNVIEKLFSVGTIKIYTGRNTENERKATDDIIAIKDPYDFFKELKKTKTDIKTDWNYPNALRPDKNPGYQTDYDPEK